jgi:hypothetical protein
MKISEAYRDALVTAKGMKNLLLFFAVAHVVFFIFGEWTVAREIPYAMHLREEQFKELRDLAFLKPLSGPLAGNLPLKILYTFTFNLSIGAFLSTTVIGAALFFMPYVIAVWRGFIVGLLFYGLDASPAVSITFYGTFLLEFGAYTFSSVAGTDIGLSLLVPSRKGVESRREAFLIAVHDARRLYFFVVVLLALAAVWEMSLLHYLSPSEAVSNGGVAVDPGWSDGGGGRSEASLAVE